MQTTSNKASLQVDFNNTEIAFRSKSNKDLRYSYLLFKVMGYNWLVNIGSSVVNTAFAIGLPIKGMIKATVFKQFCGGESIEDCDHSIEELYKYGIGTILDYSVEGKELEADFEHTAEEIIGTIKKAAKNPKIPFSVFKVTGIARFELLSKVSDKKILSDEEQAEYKKIKERVKRICQTAFDNHVRIFVDAEETWIQNAIDEMAHEMMETFNRNEAIVYNTIQLYRHDRFDFLKHVYQQSIDKKYYLGLKLVRGAYMEKERERAVKMNYADPIQPDKASSDRDYDKALKFCVEHIDRISICAGTHNEQSSHLLVSLIKENNISTDDKRIYFSQLYGMSDNLSYNLSDAGYNVAKYLPYGPVKSVLPYLFRRAQENTSVKGQAGRELTLITKEMRRRKLK